MLTQIFKVSNRTKYTVLLNPFVYALQYLSPLESKPKLPPSRQLFKTYSLHRYHIPIIIDVSQKLVFHHSTNSDSTFTNYSLTKVIPQILSQKENSKIVISLVNPVNNNFKYFKKKKNRNKKIAHKQPHHSFNSYIPIIRNIRRSELK